MDWDNMINTQEGLARMVGKTFVSVSGGRGDGEMEFRTADGEIFLFSHYQDCCESVSIEDVCGDIRDLVGEPILLAEEVSGEAPASDEDHWGSQTWTFYKFATRKGYVDVRWLGESNGYYSESVDMYYQGVA
jgi:hypothetical protein